MFDTDFKLSWNFQGFFKQREFIVTQHPLPETLEDFWKMVWDQNAVSIIVLSGVGNEVRKCTLIFDGDVFSTGNYLSNHIRIAKGIEKVHLLLRTHIHSIQVHFYVLVFP